MRRAEFEPALLTHTRRSRWHSINSVGSMSGVRQSGLSSEGFDSTMPKWKSGMPWLKTRLLPAKS